MKVKEIWPIQSENPSTVSFSTPIEKSECTKIHNFNDENKSSVQSECPSIVLSSTPIEKSECTKIHDFNDENKKFS